MGTLDPLAAFARESPEPPSFGIAGFAYRTPEAAGAVAAVPFRRTTADVQRRRNPNGVVAAASARRDPLGKAPTPRKDGFAVTRCGHQRLDHRRRNTHARILPPAVDHAACFRGDGVLGFVVRTRPALRVLHARLIRMLPNGCWSPASTACVPNAPAQARVDAQPRDAVAEPDVHALEPSSPFRRTLFRRKAFATTVASTPPVISRSDGVPAPCCSAPHEDRRMRVDDKPAAACEPSCEAVPSPALRCSRSSKRSSTSTRPYPTGGSDPTPSEWRGGSIRDRHLARQRRLPIALGTDAGGQQSRRSIPYCDHKQPESGPRCHSTCDTHALERHGERGSKSPCRREPIVDEVPRRPASIDRTRNHPRERAWRTIAGGNSRTTERRMPSTRLVPSITDVVVRSRELLAGVAAPETVGTGDPTSLTLAGFISLRHGRRRWLSIAESRLGRTFASGAAARTVNVATGSTDGRPTDVQDARDPGGLAWWASGRGVETRQHRDAV